MWNTDYSIMVNVGLIFKCIAYPLPPPARRSSPAALCVCAPGDCRVACSGRVCGGRGRSVWAHSAAFRFSNQSQSWAPHGIFSFVIVHIKFRRFSSAYFLSNGINIWICTHSSYPDFKLSDLPKGVGEGLISGFAPIAIPHTLIFKDSNSDMPSECMLIAVYRVVTSMTRILGSASCVAHKVVF